MYQAIHIRMGGKGRKQGYFETFEMDGKEFFSKKYQKQKIFWVKMPLFAIKRGNRMNRKKLGGGTGNCKTEVENSYTRYV